MHPIAAVDWHNMLVPTVSLLELILRGSVMYLVIFVAMRVFRRQPGALSTADLLVVVLVADAAQNGMASEYHSLPEAIVLVGTIFAWNYGLDWLAFRFPAIRRLIDPPPLLLVSDGRVIRRNLRAELLTMNDLAEHLREHGVTDVTEVRRCYIESDGHVSVIKRKAGDDDDDAESDSAAGR